MMQKRGKNFLQRLLEGVIAIALVLVFFAILIMVFNLLFPEGSGLNFLFDQPDNEQARAIRHNIELKVTNGDGENLLSGEEDWAATLVQTRNSVKSKKAADIAWVSARKGMRLGNLDAVQTLEGSSAVIKFDAKNFIDLGENSLIVIRRLERDLLFKEKRSFMVVVDGELRGRIVGGDQSDVYLEIETPNAVARLQSNPDDENGIEFKVDVLDDDSSAVTVYSGQGEVEASGETVLLGMNQLSRVEGNMAPTAPITLPSQVEIKNPRNREVFPYRSLPPHVSMAWEAQPVARQYHLLLATDQDFTTVLIDRILTAAEFVHGNLHDGEYFWKVSAISATGEGRFSPVHRFSLVHDQQPPELTVQFPSKAVALPEIEITGSSEPDARIYVAGANVQPGPDGSFRHRLKITPGINIVVVEAIDRAGNVSYQSQLINGKY